MEKSSAIDSDMEKAGPIERANLEALRNYAAGLAINNAKRNKTQSQFIETVEIDTDSSVL